MSEQLLKEILTEIKSIKETMVTKDYLDKVILEQQKDVIGLLKIIDEKTETISRVDAKLDALNERTFEHEADIRLLKKAR